MYWVEAKGSLCKSLRVNELSPEGQGKSTAQIEIQVRLRTSTSVPEAFKYMEVNPTVLSHKGKDAYESKKLSVTLRAGRKLIRLGFVF